jgi:hypothetical protein
VQSVVSQVPEVPSRQVVLFTIDFVTEDALLAVVIVAIIAL